MNQDARLLEDLAVHTNGILSALRSDPHLTQHLLRIPNSQYTLVQWQYALAYLWRIPCRLTSIPEIKAALQQKPTDTRTAVLLHAQRQI